VKVFTNNKSLFQCNQSGKIILARSHESWEECIDEISKGKLYHVCFVDCTETIVFFFEIGQMKWLDWSCYPTWKGEQAQLVHCFCSSLVFHHIRHSANAPYSSIELEYFAALESEHALLFSCYSSPLVFHRIRHRAMYWTGVFGCIYESLSMLCSSVVRVVRLHLISKSKSGWDGWAME
jgi:hypothetical protein